MVLWFWFSIVNIEFYVFNILLAWINWYFLTRYNCNKMMNLQYWCKTSMTISFILSYNYVLRCLLKIIYHNCHVMPTIFGIVRCISNTETHNFHFTFILKCHCKFSHWKWSIVRYAVQYTEYLMMKSEFILCIIKVFQPWNQIFSE